MRTPSGWRRSGSGTWRGGSPAWSGRRCGSAWAASPRDTVATIALNVASGVFAGYALFATTGVLQALFAGGPTPDRVRAALPSLALVAVSSALRSGLQNAAGWAQGRLEPQVDRVVEVRLFDLTTRAWNWPPTTTLTSMTACSARETVACTRHRRS